MGENVQGAPHPFQDRGPGVDRIWKVGGAAGDGDGFSLSTLRWRADSGEVVCCPKLSIIVVYNKKSEVKVKSKVKVRPLNLTEWFCAHFAQIGYNKNKLAKCAYKNEEI